MSFNKEAIGILEQIQKGDGARRCFSTGPISMCDGGQVVASGYRAFWFFNQSPLPYVSLTPEDIVEYEHLFVRWSEAWERNQTGLKMPSKNKLLDFMKKNRKEHTRGKYNAYIFSEGIALNPKYLLDMHRLLGKVEWLMWDGHPCHPVTARTEIGQSILLPIRINGGNQ